MSWYRNIPIEEIIDWIKEPSIQTIKIRDKNGAMQTYKKVKKRTWIHINNGDLEGENFYKCSECLRWIVATQRDFEQGLFKYCPRCGSRMMGALR